MMVQPVMTNTPPDNSNSSQQKVNPIVIKKYANRRLYNTDTSSYVTLDDLCKMIKDGDDVIVFDAKNGDDITRTVLTQIIVEQESKGGQSLLPTGFLRQIISYYGGNMQGLVPGYLDFAMQALNKNQGQMQEVFRNSFGSLFPMSTVQQMTKQNVALFEQTMRVFSPFAQGNQSQHPVGTPEAQQASDEQAAQAATRASASSSSSRPVQSNAQTAVKSAPVPDQEDGASIQLMQKRLDDLQKQLGALAK